MATASRIVSGISGKLYARLEIDTLSRGCALIGSKRMWINMRSRIMVEKSSIRPLLAHWLGYHLTWKISITQMIPSPQCPHQPQSLSQRAQFCSLSSYNAYRGVTSLYGEVSEHFGLPFLAFRPCPPPSGTNTTG